MVNPFEIKLTVEFGDNAFRTIGLIGVALRDLAAGLPAPGAAPEAPAAIKNAAAVVEALKATGSETEDQPELPGTPGPPAVQVADEMVPEKKQAAAIPPADVRDQPRKGIIWSAERIQLMVDMRAEKARWKEIRLAVNKLPGCPCLSDRAPEKAYFKFKSEGKLPKPSVKPSAPVQKPLQSPAAPVVAPKPVVQPPPVVAARPAVAAAPRRDPPAHLAGAGKPIRVPLSHARQWAAERGLCNGSAKLDLPMVNKKRRDLGLQEFELDGARA